MVPSAALARLAGVGAVLASLGAAAQPEEEALTGVTADHRQYRLGAVTICRVSPAGPGPEHGFGPACREVAPEAQRSLGLRRPRGRRKPIQLADGRLLEVRVRPERRAHGASRCQKPLGDPRANSWTCTQERPRTRNVLEVVARRGKDATLLVRDGEDVRRLRGVYASDDGTRVIVVYDDALPGGAVVVTVIGWDLTRRLASP
jgi:hypothetical protein